MLKGKAMSTLKKKKLSCLDDRSWHIQECFLTRNTGSVSHWTFTVTSTGTSEGGCFVISHVMGIYISVLRPQHIWFHYSWSECHLRCLDLGWGPGGSLRDGWAGTSLGLWQAWACDTELHPRGEKWDGCRCGLRNQSPGMGGPGPYNPTPAYQLPNSLRPSWWQQRVPRDPNSQTFFNAQGL